MEIRSTQFLSAIPATITRGVFNSYLLKFKVNCVVTISYIHRYCF